MTRYLAPIVFTFDETACSQLESPCGQTPTPETQFGPDVLEALLTELRRLI